MSRPTSWRPDRNARARDNCPAPPSVSDVCVEYFYCDLFSTMSNLAKYFQVKNGYAVIAPRPAKISTDGPTASSAANRKTRGNNDDTVIEYWFQTLHPGRILATGYGSGRKRPQGGHRRRQ